LLLSRVIALRPKIEGESQRYSRPTIYGSVSDRALPHNKCVYAHVNNKLFYDDCCTLILSSQLAYH